MSTADTIVKRGLNALGAHSEVNPADPQLLMIGLEQLSNILYELSADEVYVGSLVGSLTSAGVTATVNLKGHGLAVNDTVLMAGEKSGAYNGLFPVASVVDANNFTYTLPAAASSSPAVATDTSNPTKGISCMKVPVVLADNVLEQAGATAHLEMILGRRMGPLCRVPVPAEVGAAAIRAHLALTARFQQPTVQRLVPSRLLPLGQGNSRGQWPKPWFAGDPLDADTPA